jgi:hypothetical protein
MKLFLKIFASITGAGAAIAVIIAVYAYTESLKPAPITKDEVKEIVKTEISPVVTSQDIIISNQSCLYANQELIKNSFVQHIRKDTSSNNADEIINLLNGFKNDIIKEIKKNENLTPFGMNTDQL